MLAVEKEASFLEALKRGYNLFAGAGFSVRADGRLGPLPVGSQLANMLRTKFDVDRESVLELPMLYTIIERRFPQELREFVIEVFSVTKWDPRYSFVTRLVPNSIITTNVDNLFSMLFADSETRYLSDLYRTGPALSQKKGVNLAQVHGSVNDLDRPMTFGPLDLASTATVDPDRWHYVREQLGARPTLYWGYSFSDAGTLQSLRDVSQRRPAIGDAWVQIRPDKKSDAYTDFYHALGYNVIVAETADLLEYLSHVSLDVDSSSSSRVEVENIPTLAIVPQRPAEDFFTGAAPAWSDILGGSLYKTKYYAEVTDRIAGRRSTIIAGIPGCGKTTILMQVAAYYDTEMPKVFHDSLGLAEAGMLARRIGESPVLVILDNVASDVRVVEELLRCPRVVVLGADRDFAINSVYDRVSRSAVEVLGVTNQSAEDLNSIWTTIPRRLRGKRQIKPKTSWGAEPSLYEFVKSNVRDSFLSERLSRYIQEVSAVDPDLAELIVLACYLNYARSSLSSDLGLAYFRDVDLDYAVLMELIRSVGELLKEDVLEDEDLDYFTARSAMAAEEVIFGSPRRIVRDVLERFYANVSNLRIPRFDVFRRRGYDAKIFVHAFPDVERGLELYDLIQHRDESPYVSQQKALYLAKFERYSEAFAEIDAAYNSWRGRRNFTIENTFNKILFMRNIGLAYKDASAMELCRRGLAGLRACYDGDYRKGQHALVFADCVLQYARQEGAIPRDATAWLESAKSAISHVMVQESYLDRPRYLIREIAREILRLS